MKKLVLMLFVFVMFVSVVFSADITKGPWLLRPTKTSMTVMFESSLKAQATLRYGNKSKLSNLIKIDSHDKVVFTVKNEGEQVRYLYVATMDQLKPGAQYSYSVEIAGTRTKPVSFKTFSDEQGAFTFIAYGDTRSYYEAHRLVVRNFTRHDPAFILHSGDFIAPEKYASWQIQYFDQMIGVIDRRCSVDIVKQRIVVPCEGLSHDLSR